MQLRPILTSTTNTIIPVRCSKLFIKKPFLEECTFSTIGHLQGFSTCHSMENCYVDEEDSLSVFSVFMGKLADNSVESCKSSCVDYNFALVKNGLDCWCSNVFPKSRSAPKTECNVRCPGNNSQFCGGFQRINIYETGNRRIKNFARNTFIQIGLTLVDII